MYANKICSNGLKPPLPYGFAAGRGLDICNGPHRRASRPGRECQPSVRENLIPCTICPKNSGEQAIKRLHLLGREPARVTTWKALSTTLPKPLWIPGGYGVLGPLLPEGVEHRYSPRKTSHKDSAVEYFCER